MVKEDDGALRVTVDGTSASAWDAVLVYGNVSLVEGERYLLRFKARADAERAYSLHAMLQESPYGPAGPVFQAAMGRQYRDFEFSFVAGGASAGKKIMLPFFPLGLSPGSFWLRDVSLVGALSPLSRKPETPLPPGFFPYAVDWDDSLAGTATDLSFLNAKPAGANGRIVARDGHLFEEKTGTRIRFFGVNIDHRWSYPGKADAELVAGRLAKAGINLVRFALPQWDQVSFRPTGTGNWNNTIFNDPERGHADIFDTILRGYQLGHARSLLSHVNPYTGESYAQDE